MSVLTSFGLAALLLDSVGLATFPFLTSDPFGLIEMPLSIPAALPFGMQVSLQWFAVTDPTCRGSGPLGTSERLDLPLQ